MVWTVSALILVKFLGRYRRIISALELITIHLRKI